MEDQFKETFRQASAFQNMWMDSMSGMAKVWSTYSPSNPPPEELKKVRNGMLKAMSNTWEEYMRTPEFLDFMRKTMNSTTQWQKFTKNGANRMQSAMGSSNKDDIQGIMEAIQHVERRVLDSIEDLDGKLSAIRVEVDKLAAKSNDAGVRRFEAEVLKRLNDIEKAMSKAVSTPNPVVRKAAKAETTPFVVKPVTKKKVAKKAARKVAAKAKAGAKK